MNIKCFFFNFLVSYLFPNLFNSSTVLNENDSNFMKIKFELLIKAYDNIRMKNIKTNDFSMFIS